MERVVVQSSNLRSVGYDSALEILEIEFHTSSIYDYFEVPASVHAGLMNASSHGSYFHRFIKDKYRYTRIQ